MQLSYKAKIIQVYKMMFINEFSGQVIFKNKQLR